MMWVLLVSGLYCVVQGKFTRNFAGHPQELNQSTDVCDGRSSICSVLLDVPEACAGSSSACPVVLMLHGHSSTNLKYKYNPWIHKYNFLGVYPQGEIYRKQSGWNDGSMKGLKCKWDDFNCTEDPNDGKFMAKIVSVIQRMGGTGRFYIYGGSNGANEAGIIASNACSALPFAGSMVDSGQLLANPPQSGGGPYNFNQPCAGSKPCTGGRKVAQLSFHGTADPLISIDGGPKFDSDVFILMDEMASDQLWATQNGCSGFYSESIIPALTRDAHGSLINTTATHYVWSDCPATVPVEYYKVKDGGHVGTVSVDGKEKFEVMLEFFQKIEKAHEASLLV